MSRGRSIGVAASGKAESKPKEEAGGVAEVPVVGNGQAVPKGYNVVYGYNWPKGKNLLPLELQCYRMNRQAEDGGLGALRHFRNAWGIMWPKFEWNDWTRLLVEAWCDPRYRRISVMGHAAAGKTYSVARIALLDWLANPFETMTSLATVTAEGLRLRMWGDLMRAYEEMPAEIKYLLKVYNTPNRMNVMMEGESESLAKYIIEGMSVTRTKDAMGRIRGKHAPRRRVVLDEADDMPQAAYDAFANIMTDPDVKIVDMSNAVDRYSCFGRSCEPKGGWGSVSETDLFWESKEGGIVIHLDGLQNPNMKLTRAGEPDRFPYMLGPGRIEAIRTQFGEDSVEWWSMVRGFFPPDGIVAKVFPNQVIEKARGKIEWDFAPEPCATLDPAFEMDDCVLHRGEKGKLRDGRSAIQAILTVRITVKESALESKDYQIAREVVRLCKEWGVAPKNYIQDKTGNGRGVFAIIQEEWSREVQGINYGGEATDRPFKVGDVDKANEVVRYFVSELWFRARYLCEAGCLAGLASLDQKTIDDLNVRRYKSVQMSTRKLMQVETKDELKKRLGRSPDYGDAFVQFGELLARDLASTALKVEGKIPSAQWDKARMGVRKLNRIYQDAIEVQAW